MEICQRFLTARLTVHDGCFGMHPVIPLLFPGQLVSNICKILNILDLLPKNMVFSCFLARSSSHTTSPMCRRRSGLRFWSIVRPQQHQKGSRGWCVAVVRNLCEFCENLGKPRENQNIPWFFHGLESNFLTKMANRE